MSFFFWSTAVIRTACAAQSLDPAFVKAWEAQLRTIRGSSISIEVKRFEHAFSRVGEKQLTRALLL